ncbi:MAG: alpha/beta hydrolase [Chloroflexaceae bacterium]|nr:alpha/beta hydrolase [Chloroflexaceae bacterium]
MAGLNNHTNASNDIHRIDLSNTTLAYRQSNHIPDKGEPMPPLILIHGWGGSSRNWQYTIERLADMRLIYALDLPGYGDSPPLEDPPNWDHMSQIVVDFADALGLKQFDLNGHSFGAGVSAYVASRWSDRVRSLILTCFSTYRNELERRVVEQFLRQMGLSVAMWQPWMALWEPWMALWQPWMVWMGGISSMYQALAWRFFHRMPSNERLLQEGFEDFLRMDGRTALVNASSASDPTLNAALADIRVPTMIVGTRQDMIMPPSGVEVVAQLVGQGQPAWIDQCGHLPMLEQPDQYHQLVRRFLQ